MTRGERFGLVQGDYPNTRRPWETFALDLTDADRTAELAWFAEAFATDLTGLARYFGSPPELRWGLAYVSW